MTTALKANNETAPILIAGGGNAARAAALSLAAAGLPVMVEPQLAEAPDAADDWQSVLALSPAAQAMLQALNVWSHLDLPSSPILDMYVYAGIDDVGVDDIDSGLLPARLGFGSPPESGETAAALAHIVSLAGLGRALHAALGERLDAKQISCAAAPIADFKAGDKPAILADGSVQRLALLVDCYRATPPWRGLAAAQDLTADYDAAALIGTLQSNRPHGQMAAQIFLPDGPLALLPLPDKDRLALVWSLPRAKAKALAALSGDVLAHEMRQATQGRFGDLTPQGNMAVQPLALSLAQQMTGPSYVRLGDAAHVVHPLAGQGFNLSLRDAALLADTLYAARRLGLPSDDATMLAQYQQARRGDAAVTAATTHGLAALFTGRMAPLGRLGLAVMGRAAKARPAWRAAFSAQANAGITADTMPRLMQGKGFPNT